MAQGKPNAILSQARIALIQEILGNHFQDTLFWCNSKLAQQRGLQFYQTRSNAVVLYDTLSAEFIEKAICIKTEEQLNDRESARPRVVAQSKFAMCITKSTQTRSKIILVKHKAMHRASGKQDATLWITEFQAYPSQQFNSRMNKDNRQLPS